MLVRLATLKFRICFFCAVCNLYEEVIGDNRGRAFGVVVVAAVVVVAFDVVKLGKIKLQRRRRRRGARRQ